MSEFTDLQPVLHRLLILLHLFLFDVFDQKLLFLLNASDHFNKAFGIVYLDA